jgi:hypothetical protein
MYRYLRQMTLILSLDAGQIELMQVLMMHLQ